MKWAGLKTKIQDDSPVWVLGRTGLVCFAGFVGYLEEGPARPHAPVSLLLLFGILGLAFTLLFVLALSLADSRSPWQLPKWSVSPFRLDKPLQFPWFAGNFILAGASGMLLGALVRRSGDWESISKILALGIGLKLGLRLTRRLFRKRFPGAPPDQVP